MIAPRRHADEARRLAALARLGLLDTPREERFDRLTRLAAAIVGTPISLITLVDDDRQWFKSAIGLGGTGTPRDHAFCAHAIHEDDILVVEDAWLDERFHDNPLVTDDPNIRFYAGAVLREPGGLPIGTVCAIDIVPRQLDEAKRQALIDLASLVEDEITKPQLAEALSNLEQSDRGRTMVFDALSEGLVVQDPAGRIVEWNPAAERLLGLGRGELEGLTSLDPRWRAIHEDGSPLQGDEHPTAIARTTGDPVVDEIVGVHRADESIVWLKVNACPIVDGGELQGVLATFADVTEAIHAQRLMNATLDTAPVGIAMLDAERRIARCNDRFAHQVGRPPGDLVGADAWQLLGGELVPGEPRHDHLVRPDGSEIWLTNHLAVLDETLGNMAVLASHDDTDQHHLLSELTQFEHLFRHANDIITVIGSDGHVVYASPSNERVLGYPDDYRHAGGVLALIHPDDMERATAELAALVAGTRGPEPFSVRVAAYDGSWRHVECVGVNLLDEPSVNGVVITARDTTERQRLTDELAHRAAHDQLTDLPNRHILEQRLGEALARSRRDHRLVGVCFVDLDGFKAVNDTLGHAAGDQLLIDVADCLRQVVRGGDTPARVGGDEFVVVLDPISGVNDALIAARRLRNAIVGLSKDLPDHIDFGASIGVAVSEHEDTPEAMLKRADGALYRAKAHGRSSIDVADRLYACSPLR